MTTHRVSRFAGAALLTLAAGASSCTAGVEDDDFENGPRAGGSAGLPGGAGSGGAPLPGGSGGTTDPNECAAKKYEGELVPLDMFIMLDRSGSMIPSLKQPTDRWTPVTGAISAFVNTPVSGHVGVGLGFFPPVARPESCFGDGSCGQFGPCDPLGVNGCIGYCKASLYESPVVAIQPLPGAGAPISSAISRANAHPSGGTPMAEGLAGAIAYAKKVKLKYPNHVVTLVLATDGEPSGPPGQGCQESLDAVAAQAAAGFAADIRTFVIGVGNQAPNLDAVAKAGGTDKALRADDGSDINKLFQQKLTEIRGEVACQYLIPPPPEGETADFNKVNVDYAATSGATQSFPRAGSAALCADNLAYYYDDPNAPTKILLCPKACDAVKAGGGAVFVKLGCESKIVPPPS